MTKFIFLTDTHLGAESTGYFEQQKYPERLTEILHQFDNWIKKNGNIDFIIHGGDIVESPTDELMRAAEEQMTKLSLPVYLCLGNHDISDNSMVSKWLNTTPALFSENNSHTYTIKTDSCFIHIIPNHYKNGPYLQAEQLQYLDKSFNKYNTSQHILITHYPVSDIPAEQLGEIIETPPIQVCTDLLKYLENYNNIPLLLCGHSHVNTCTSYCSTTVATCSSLIETPFEFKVIEIDDKIISMNTITLAPSLEFIGDYNFDKTFVQGRAIDRSFQQKIQEIT